MLRNLFAGVIALASATAAAAQDYPIVFADKTLLRDLGVTIRDVGPQQPVAEFHDRCYYYGDGGYSLSLSPEFIAGYASRGFSVGALCMGVLSGVRFHPTTGARLATFVVADAEAIKQYGPDPYAMSTELTLEVPACFAGGKPLAECDWRFDPNTGEALNANGLNFVATLSEKARVVGETAVSSGVYDRVCGQDEAFGGECRLETYPMSEDTQYIVGMRAREAYVGTDWPVSFFDISPDFPGGYGYALFADGAAGPSAQIDAEKIALDPKKRASMAIIEGLKLKLK